MRFHNTTSTAIFMIGLTTLLGCAVEAENVAPIDLIDGTAPDPKSVGTNCEPIGSYDRSTGPSYAHTTVFSCDEGLSVSITAPGSTIVAELNNDGSFRVDEEGNVGLYEPVGNELYPAVDTRA